MIWVLSTRGWYITRSWLGGGIRYGPRSMPLDFGLGPKSNMAAMVAILKKYLIFFFCISTCFKWFPTKNMPNYNCGWFWNFRWIYPRKINFCLKESSYDEWIEYVNVKSKRESCKLTLWALLTSNWMNRISGSLEWPSSIGGRGFALYRVLPL